MSAANSFEGKLHAFRRTQEGVVVSYVVHPSDVSAAMATASLGTRYMIAFAEVGDDGKPVTAPSPANDVVKSDNKKTWDELAPSAQAGIRCGEPQFWEFADVKDADGAARFVRGFCRVASRSEIAPGTEAARLWMHLERDYQAYLTSSKYGSLAR
jgi:hypothetical protein